LFLGSPVIADSRRLAGVAPGWRSASHFCSSILLLIACAFKLLSLRSQDDRLLAGDPEELHRWDAIGDFSCSPWLSLAASALFIYIVRRRFFLANSSPSETSFAWLFVPMITGIMVGSLALVASRIYGDLNAPFESDFSS
jgi:hypothetical protein